MACLPVTRIFLQYASASGQPWWPERRRVLPVRGDQCEHAGVPDDAGQRHHECTGRNAHVLRSRHVVSPQVTDNAALAGGVINDVTLHIEYVTPTGLKPRERQHGSMRTGRDVAGSGNSRSAATTFINRRWVEDRFGNNNASVYNVYTSMTIRHWWCSSHVM